jgi:hypothetical protein
MHPMIGVVTGWALCRGIWLGDERGLCRVRAGGGPAAAEQVAAMRRRSRRNGQRNRAAWALALSPCGRLLYEGRRPGRAGPPRKGPGGDGGSGYRRRPPAGRRGRPGLPGRG